MSNEMNQRADIQSVEFEAVIIRKDGTIENLGTVSYWNKNPIKRLLFSLKKLAKNFYNKLYSKKT